MEFEKKEKLEIEGYISSGKQFDLDIRLPEDNRDVIYGIIRDPYGDPVSDAVVKLIEIDEHKKRLPVTHTFTDEHGEFVFGPLCPHKKYAIEVWANRVDHIKICEICRKKGKCLKGIELDCEKHPKADYKDTEDNCECDEI